MSFTSSAFPRWPPPVLSLAESSGLHFVSSSWIGPEIFGAKPFLTGPRIGPEKMAKKKSGKNNFQPGPPVSLGELILHIFSAEEKRKKSLVKCIENL